jgi:hypothetical protein
MSRSSSFVPGLLLILTLGTSAAAPRAGAPANGAAQLVLLPDAIVLRGQGSRQQILVEERAVRLPM